MTSVKHNEQQNQTVKMVMRQAMTEVLGEAVSEDLVEKLWHSGRRELLQNSADLKAVATLILDLCRSFSKKNGLSEAERIEVKKDAARRLKSVALSHAGCYPETAVKILWQAVRLEHRPPLMTCLKILYRLVSARLGRI
jgi:hypothetical protein